MTEGPLLTPWAQARARLETAPRLAFDLEGDFNLHRYGRRICLFQVALDDGTVFLLDPLESGPQGPPDWPGWKELMENPAVTKVIWAAQNDVRALKSCHGIALRGLWDLFDAACLAVTARPSLPFLVSTFLGITIEKAESLQTSDWNTRPLSPEQRAYAAQDVHFLLALADRLDPLIDQKRKREAFRARMEAAEGYEFHDHLEPWRRLKGAAALPPERIAVLEGLWRRRETLSRDLDLAPWRLVAPEELVHLAREGRFSSPELVDPRWSSG
jgi:ribonuclease D